MKKFFWFGGLIVMVMIAFVPYRAFALGLEASIGYWMQTPSGDLAYKGDGLDLVDDLGYDQENMIFARVKGDMPLFLPNMYIMATPMQFESKGEKTTSFTFGDKTFTGGVPFTSTVKADHYDVGIYYSVPLTKTVTLGTLNMEVGLTARIFDFEVEMEQKTLGIKESESFIFPVPMIYAGVQLSPEGLFDFEVEGRVIAYQSNSYLDLLARVKAHPFGPAFVGAGYRYENLKIDYEDVEVTIAIGGPFVEVGMEF